MKTLGERYLWTLAVNAVIVAIIAAVPAAKAAQGDLADDLKPVEPAIEKGAKWLAENQAADGHWGADKKTGPTALAMMALQAPSPQGAYTVQIDKALQYLLRLSESRRGFMGESMHEHGLAMMGLAQHVQGKRGQEVARALEQGVAVITRAQNASGGWTYQSAPGRDDLCNTIAAVNGLAAARLAGIAVPDGVLTKAAGYIESCQAADSGGFAYTPGAALAGYHRTAAAAAALLACGRADSKAFKSGLEYLTRQIGKVNPADENYLYGQYFASYVMPLAARPAYAAWYRAAAIAVMKKQAASGSAAGSWPGGIGHETPMAILILGAAKRNASAASQPATQPGDILDYAARLPSNTIRVDDNGAPVSPKYGAFEVDAAAKALADIPRPWTVEKMIALYRTAKDPQRKAHILWVLAASRDPRAGVLLGEVLINTDEPGPQTAAATYGLMTFFVTEVVEGGSEQHAQAVLQWWRKNERRLRAEAAALTPAVPAATPQPSTQPAHSDPLALAAKETTALVEAIRKRMPANWHVPVAEPRSPAGGGNWPRGAAVVIHLERIGFKPRDAKRGIGGAVTIMVMVGEFAPISVPPDAAAAGNAGDLGPWRGHRVFALGHARDWQKWQTDVQAAMDDTKSPAPPSALPAKGQPGMGAPAPTLAAPSGPAASQPQSAASAAVSPILPAGELPAKQVGDPPDDGSKAEKLDSMLSSGVTHRRVVKDAQGRPVRTILYTSGPVQRGSDELALAEWGTTTFAYDAAGRLVTTAEYRNRTLIWFVQFEYWPNGKKRLQVWRTADGVRTHELRYPADYPADFSKQWPLTELHFDTQSGGRLLYMAGPIPEDHDLAEGWGKPTGPLRCGISVRDGTVTATIANTGDTPSPLARDTDGNIARLELFDASGKAMAYHKSRWLSGTSHGGAPTLRPKHATYEHYSVEDWFGRVLPGKYTVRLVRRSTGRTFDLVSNTVTYEALPPTPRAPTSVAPQPEVKDRLRVAKPAEYAKLVDKVKAGMPRKEVVDLLGPVKDPAGDVLVYYVIFPNQHVILLTLGLKDDKVVSVRKDEWIIYVP
ncbi:MAG: prenyltransferase/squalene oxidase repeat-containing protein [Planctomycetaceae bacterium]|nr:hypothetical protein [Planctomycetaceae bacterium]